MVVWHKIMDEEMMPLLIGYSSIEYVDTFTYLSSVVASNTRFDADMDGVSPVHPGPLVPSSKQFLKTVT